MRVRVWDGAEQINEDTGEANNDDEAQWINLIITLLCFNCAYIEVGW